jgi:hypothetical protein
MKIRAPQAVTWIMFCGPMSLAIPEPALAQRDDPAAVYLRYRAAVASASKAADVIPYLPKARQDLLQFATPSELETWLEKYKIRRNQKNIRVLKKIDAKEGVLLIAEGVDAADERPLQGRIKMNKDGDEWIVEDEQWFVEFVPAAERDAAAADYAKGVFIVNDQRIQLKHAYVKVVPYTFDRDGDYKRPALELTLSDKPIDPAGTDLWQRAQKGELHFIRLSIGPDQNVIGGMMHHNAYQNAYVSLAGMHNLEAERFGPTAIKGKAFLDKPHEVMGDTTFYSVEFHATVLE